MKGVVTYIRDEGENNICLTMDDVEAGSISENPDWKHNVLFTTRNYDSETLKNLELTKEEFAQIGEDLIIRLLALRGEIK